LDQKLICSLPSIEGNKSSTELTLQSFCKGPDSFVLGNESTRSSTLIKTPLGFMPKIWLSPPVAAKNAKITSPTPSFSLSSEILSAIDSVDLDLIGMPSNGGLGGCRYSEVVASKDYDKAKCSNKFEKDTKAKAHLEIRSVEGQDFSEIRQFYVTYDKTPHRLGIAVGGFYVNHPLNPDSEGPLDVNKEDPFETGKDFRKALRPKAKSSLGDTVPNSSKSSQLMMRPQGWLVEDALGVSFDITKNTLLASGLWKENFYTDLGLEPFQFPRRLDQLVALFSKGDSCYTKRKESIVKQPNFLHDLPPLIQWLAPEKLSLKLLLREKKISLGDLGSIQLGKKEKNAFTLESDAKNMRLTIQIGALPNLDLKLGNYKISAKSIKAGKIQVTLPPLPELSKSLGWLDTEKASVVIDRCLNPDKYPKSKKDYSELLKKIILGLSIEDISAEQITLENTERSLKVTLQAPKIASISFPNDQQIVLRGLQLDSLDADDATSGVKANIKAGKIKELQFENTPTGPKIKLSQVKSDEISAGVLQNKVSLKLGKSSLESLNLDGSQKGKLDLTLQSIASEGAFRYHNQDEGMDIEGKGLSKISSLDFHYQLDPSGAFQVESEVHFSGKVQEFKLVHPSVGNLALGETEFGESSFKAGLKWDANATKPSSSNISVSLDLPKAEVKEGHVRLVDVGDSSLKNGKIQLEKSGDVLTAQVSGNLNLKLKKIDIPPIDLILKGFSLQGSLEDIEISGAGVLTLGPTAVSLSKLNPESGGATLQIKGLAKDLKFSDDPSQRSESLKKLAYNKAVKSQMALKEAKVGVGDLEEFEFLLGSKDKAQKPNLKTLKVKDFGITEIRAGGRIWANFPVFGWLMGKFPEIGKATKALPNQDANSEIRFDEWDTHEENGSKVTRLNKLLVQLFEVGGRNQLARFFLPSLQVSPGKIDTGKEPMELEVFLKDQDRGGEFEFKLKDEDLSKRRRRKAPTASKGN